MPDFKTTWTNTYDYYGSHAHQRFLGSQEFSALFRAVPGMTVAFERAGNIRASKSHLAINNTGGTPMPEGSG
jgi:hypothetical protein